ncbi:hypothetical protein [Pontibacter litorisediminis]|uniref:hypothetical protein n=1 Tax=Pontibacter litorisediminis TaxID=1846260 RepID=UPI0023EADFD9|nr:hypothetical protein [Pontibacter litorisediminis]
MLENKAKACPIVMAPLPNRGKVSVAEVYPRAVKYGLLQPIVCFRSFFAVTCWCCTLPGRKGITKEARPVQHKFSHSLLAYRKYVKAQQANIKQPAASKATKGVSAEEIVRILFNAFVYIVEYAFLYRRF